MKAEIYSALASAISAACAMFTVYMFRSHGKGFVWTKDQNINVIAEGDGRLHVQIAIPLFNFGKGNIKFIKLRAKKINLATKAMENYETDMDEAYFPEGVSVITYQTTIHTDLPSDSKQQILIMGGGTPQSEEERKEYQEKINKKISDIPEHIIILKCTYKDGSWFGKRTKETVVGFSVADLRINYLSTSRRKELNEYFSW